MKSKTFSDILEELSEDSLARMRKKVPEWAGVPGMEYPTRLAGEQCSSSATAAYKAALVERIRPGCRLLADLTGGLGVDCAAFSRVCGRVLYNEMDAALAAAAGRNFSRLGIANASFSCVEVSPETLPELLADGPEIVFLDPARRSGGRKVFRPEDCSPDVTALMPGLLAGAPDILLKLSPMADISMILRWFGDPVREIHAVGADGECKELLVWMQRGWAGGCTIVAEGLRFTAEEEAAAAAQLPAGRCEPGGLLFEPSAALLKAGCFNLLCSRLGLFKLGYSTHLYYTADPSEGLGGYGKLFRILEVAPFDGRSIKDMGRRYPHSSVTARNLPVSSDALAKRMGAAQGGDTHIFAFTADYAGAPSERLLAVTERI